MKILIKIIALLIFVLGCATTYKPNGFTGGYSEIQLDENVFKISFRGNGYTSRERVTDFALLRSAELTLSNGYNFFAIIDEKNYTSYSSYITPKQSYTTGSATISGNNISGSAKTTTTGGQTIHISKPSTSNTIICFKDKPNSIFTYNANFINKNIREKYRLPIQNTTIIDINNETADSKESDTYYSYNENTNPQNVYFNITKVVNNYCLISTNDPTKFNIGDVYEIVRYVSKEYSTVGKCKVVKIKNNNIALQIIKGTIQPNDKLKYNK